MAFKNKTEQLNKLFDDWEINIPQYNRKFIRDGIINEECYQNASLKILFIAKEPNNPNQEADDARKWWEEDVYHPFGYRIAEWSYGLLNKFPVHDQIWEEKGAAPEFDTILI